MARLGRTMPNRPPRAATIPVVNRPVSSSRAIPYGVGGAVSSQVRVPYVVNVPVSSTRQAPWTVNGQIASTRILPYGLTAAVASTRRVVWDTKDGVTFTVEDNFLTLLGRLSVGYGTPLQSFAMGTGGLIAFTSSDIALTEALRLLMATNPGVLREGL